MNRYMSRIRQPVKRQRAEFYVLVMLVSFAVTVVGTRWYLEMTGYPQIGSGSLHIAHVLWGGLLLFVAALLPLILANRPIYPLAALLAGVGVGLFIDEVGKFVTHTNDYFFPAAAPLIYAFFLLTVLVYVQVRRPASSDARAELYRALEELSEVLDHDLEPHERVALTARLKVISQQADEPELARLASQLFEFLDAESVRLQPSNPTFWQNIVLGAYLWADHWLPRRRMQVLLGAALCLAGLPGALALATLGALALRPIEVVDSVRRELATLGPNRLSLLAANDVTGTTIYLVLVAAAGVPLIVAGLFFLLGRERAAMAISYFSLLLGLTIVYLLLFYFQQFHAATGATVAFLLLLAVIYYRHRFGLAPPIGYTTDVDGRSAP